MDFTKFVSMLDQNGLFFSRIDMFDDLFEGSYSLMNKNIKHIGWPFGYSPIKSFKNNVFG